MSQYVRLVWLLSPDIGARAVLMAFSSSASQLVKHDGFVTVRLDLKNLLLIGTEYCTGPTACGMMFAGKGRY